MRAEKTFLRNITKWYILYSKFTTFTDFKNARFFFEKPIYFFNKTKFWTFWEILLFSSHSTANLLQFDEKIDLQTREQPMLAPLRELNWQTSGKKTHPFEKNFAFHIFKMAQNNKTAGYHRQIFHPPILLKMPSKKMIAISFQKYSSIKFC